MEPRRVIAVCIAVLLVPTLAMCVPSFSAITPDSGALDSAADAAADTTLLDDASDAASNATDAFDAPSDGSGLSLSVYIPEGGFTMQPQSPPGIAVTFTHGFRFDRFEVSVRQIQLWDAAGRPPPCGGIACDLDPAGPYAGRMRWDPTWNANVAAEGYRDAGSCSNAQNTTYNQPNFGRGDPQLPASCVNWYQAVAICAHFGKRLPTEAEWEYVASGRGQGKLYPWGPTPTPDCTRAIWGNGDTVTHMGCGWPKENGTAALGAARDGVYDLAGSLYEWVWDYQAGNIPSAVVDYAGPDAGTDRGTRGGSFGANEPQLRTYFRDLTNPGSSYADVGVRCVQTVQ